MTRPDEQDSEDSSTDAESPGNEDLYIHHFDLTVGETVVEDRQTAEQKMMWKVEGKDESYVSPSLTDAIMGCIERITGGEL